MPVKTQRGKGKADSVKNKPHSAKQATRKPRAAVAIAAKPRPKVAPPLTRKPHAALNQASGHVRRVDSALTRYEKACHTAAARGEDLAALASLISAAAVEKYSAGIVRELCKIQLLRDILELRDAMAEHAPGTLSPRFEALRLLPDAFMQWFETRFGLVPTGTVGNELEIPVSRLRNYTCRFDVPADSSGLVRVRVAAAGWKRGDTLVIPPCVCLTDQPKPVAPGDDHRAARRQSALPPRIDEAVSGD